MTDATNLRELERSIEEITSIARGMGLDFFPMRFEICPADIINTLGAYGMPTRFNHWSFGKAFHRVKTQYDFGLSKIYELVINSDPCYAFLLDGNSLIQNKLIVAHVLAHSDFFKNNARFSKTNRNMVESMSATADRFHQYELQYGIDAVESFIDAVLSIQEHIDPGIVRAYPEDRKRYDAIRAKPPEPRLGRYDDLWLLDRPPAGEAEAQKPEQSFPPQPEKDILWFIAEYSPKLEHWQRDIMSALREEMFYFWPQLETKIMNEGWASYWHLRILRELDLTPEETVEFSRLHASVVQPSRHQLNPYHLGLKIFEHIERRWDRPTAEEAERFGRQKGRGRAQIFEVREFDMDTSFIRNYLTKELADELDLYVYEKQGPEWKITDTAWENVREQIIRSRVNGGFPYIAVADGDYRANGELYLTHRYEQTELDLKYVEKTLPYVYRLWGRPVHLETVIEGKSACFTFDGHKIHRQFL